MILWSLSGFKAFEVKFHEKDTSQHFNSVIEVEGYPGNKLFYHTLLFATRYQYIWMASNW